MNLFKNLFKNKSNSKKVDPAQLKKEHPHDPRIGQGYNDARGEIGDPPNPQHHNIKNNLGPEQKRPRPKV